MVDNFDSSSSYFYPPAFGRQHIRHANLVEGPQPELPTTPAIVATNPVAVIEGTAYQMKEGTLRVSHRIAAESRASFVLLDPAGTIELEDHMHVYIATFDSAAGGPIHIFGGFIQNAEAFGWLPSGSRRWVVDCFGYRYLAEKRIVSKLYESETVGTIINDLTDVGSDLAAEFVIQATVSSSGSVTRLEFIRNSIAEILDEVARHTGSNGSHWLIRPFASSGGGWIIDRELDFKAIGTAGDPSHDIDSADVLRETARIQRFSPEYFNRVHMTDAKDELTGLVETQKGDGDKRSFAFGYPIARVPTVETDVGAGFVARTVGIKGVETGKDWYWNQGSEVITQDPAGTVLGSSHKIRLNPYVGLVDMHVIAQNGSEVERLAFLEGSSGKVERVISEYQGVGVAGVTEQATAHLREAAKRGIRFSFETRKTHPVQVNLGGSNVVDVPEVGLNAEAMILEGVDVVDDPANATAGVRYRLTWCTAAAFRAAWEDSFRSKPARLDHKVNVLEVSI